MTTGNLTRIGDRFQELSIKGETAFIPFITAGDPNLEVTRELLFGLKDAGADVIELGIPYSDPLADGPVIQAAAIRSLSSGTTLPRVLEFVRQVREEGFDLPIILFTYVNPVLQRGVDRFFNEAKESGADGVIIPDLPVEEANEAIDAATRYGLDLIPLVAPTSQARIEKICRTATGFVYCVSSLGVTGTRESLTDSLPQFVQNVRRFAKVPVAVGFGVSTPDHARQISQYADGVIVGSALVKRVEQVALALKTSDFTKYERSLQEFRAFAASLKAPLKAV